MKKVTIISMLLILMTSAPFAFGQKVIQIAAGTDQIAAAYAQADSGDIIELITSGGTYLETGTLKIKIALTIKTAEGLSAKPIIETENVDRPFEPTGNCTFFSLKGVRVTGLVDDGVVDKKDSTKYAMRVRNMNGPYSIVCEDVDFDHFYSTDATPEGYVIRVDASAPRANEIRFTNCTFTRIAKHVLRFDNPTVAPGQFDKLFVENCTFAQTGGRGIYATLMNDPLVTPAEVFVNHCTFYGIQDDALKINNGLNTVVKNSIFNTISDKVLDADSAAVYSTATISFCDTLQTDGFGEFLTLTTSNIYAEDPEFNDPANFDFHISSFFASIAIGDDGTVIGDPRWSVPTGIEVTDSNLPTKFNLNQNYPNPFNPTTRISYALPKDAQVKLMVFNVLGQKVKTLIDEQQGAGYKVVHWDGRDENGIAVVSGVYLFRIEAGEFSATKKMLMLK